MASLAPRTRKTLEELETLMGSADIPPRVARSCEYLVERLHRPIRVGLIGFETEQRKRLLSALLGTEVLPERMAWPTIEIGFAEKPHTKATLADASTLSADGMPQPDLLDRDAVFLEVGAPIDALRRVTLLHLAAGEGAAEQSAALRWAARRIDFALWCTRDFSPLEARIWDAAAPELKNHAYLVAFAPDPGPSGLRGRAPPGFERVMVLPTGNAARTGAEDLQAGASGLFAQLASDIDDALGEDLDAARVLLLRFGRSVGTSEPEPAPVEPPATGRRGGGCAGHPGNGRPGRSSFRAAHLSQAPGARPVRGAGMAGRCLPEWTGEVLGRCCEVTDGLRDRAAEWPEDVGPVSALRRIVDEASDMSTLLQIEGGAEQAADAAALLLQIRSAFETNLAWPATPVN